MISFPHCHDSHLQSLLVQIRNPRSPLLAKLRIKVRSMLEALILSTIKGVSLHTAFDYLPSHGPDMTKILLKRVKNGKSSIHQLIQKISKFR